MIPKKPFLKMVINPTRQLPKRTNAAANRKIITLHTVLLGHIWDHVLDSIKFQSQSILNWHINVYIYYWPRQK